MRGSVVEVKVAFLYVLAVIALFAREAKETFFEEWITAIPQGDGEADLLVAVADSGQAVFIPAVGSGAGVVVREIIPGVAVGAVVLADRAPGAFAEVGSPAFPVLPALPRLG